MIASLRDLRFGLELEFTNASRSQAAKAIASVLGASARAIQHETSYDRRTITGPDGRQWSVCSDASVTGSSADKGGEFVSPICTYADLETIQQIVRKLRTKRSEGGAGAKVDASCGIHIHVDGANFSGSQVINLVNLVNKQQDLICDALTIAPMRRARWCQDIDPTLLERLQSERPTTLEGVRAVWYSSHGENPNVAAYQHYAGSRYHGVNIHSLFYRGTIEFRWFEASLHAGKVKGYIQFILALAFRALTMTRANPARREYRAGNTKFHFRGFLKNLRLVGPEFKTCREHLLSPLAGPATHRIRE